MTSTERGRSAERAAGVYLERLGYEVLDYNWRTKYCEIDIVARKQSVIHFVEVKYRQSARQGSGLEYVTEKKLAQMRFAAELWVSTHNWPGDYVLSAIEVSGTDYAVGTFVESI